MSSTACARAHSHRHRPLQKVSARHEACPLECSAACDILRMAPCCRYTPALVANALEFLNQVRANAVSSERLSHLHVDVAVGTIVMEQHISSRGNDACHCHEPRRLGV